MTNTWLYILHFFSFNFLVVEKDRVEESLGRCTLISMLLVSGWILTYVVGRSVEQADWSKKHQLSYSKFLFSISTRPFSVLKIPL